jgi:GR25 family glycosyltransferase involved in LPS biosynthesis
VQLCPRPKNTMKEVACSVSHTTAIRNIFHRIQPGTVPREYGIVLEDDMRFVFNIDFDALVASAPKDWGILQVSIFNSPHNLF